MLQPTIPGLESDNDTAHMLLIHIWPFLRAANALERLWQMHEGHKEEPEMQARIRPSLQDAEHHVWEELAALIRQWDNSPDQAAA
jgi:hypothetical protein